MVAIARSSILQPFLASRVYVLRMILRRRLVKEDIVRKIDARRIVLVMEATARSKIALRLVVASAASAISPIVPLASVMEVTANRTAVPEVAIASQTARKRFPTT